MSIQVLSEFSKEEILEWLRKHSMLLGRARRRDLLFIRWDLASKKFLADFEAELARWAAEKPDFAKRDALVMQCNATDDIKEKLRLRREIEPYDRALQNHIERMTRLNKREKQVDRMYRQIGKAAP